MALQQQHGCITLVFLVLLVTLCSVGPRPTEAQVTNILEGPFHLDGSTAGGLDDWDEVFASNTTQGILDHTFYAPDVASENGKRSGFIIWFPLMKDDSSNTMSLNHQHKY